MTRTCGLQLPKHHGPVIQMRCVSVMFSDGKKRRTGDKSSILSVKIDCYVRTGIKDLSSTYRETEKECESNDRNSSSAGGEMQIHRGRKKNTH